MDILHEIAERTKERIETRKKALPLEKLKEMVDAAIGIGGGAKGSCIEGGGVGGDFPFEKALKTNDIAFICEIKKASPSKGIIAEDYPYPDIAREYEASSADAISVLTEPYYFQGADCHLREIAGIVNVPLLRKDFIVDAYMIYEAKFLGADAVLLICSLLDEKTLAEYIGVAHNLGLSALVETHDEFELKMALDAGARIVGVNNRNLKTFEVDTNNSIRLRKLAPSNIIFVSESGIKDAEDVDALRRCGVDAVLVGEALMRAPDKKAALASLRGKPYAHPS